MQQPHVTDLIPAYALGALEADEVEIVERHLEGCAECSAEARLAARISDELLLAPALASPGAPPAVRERLLAQARTLGPSRGRDATAAAEPTPAASATPPTPEAPRAPRGVGRLLRAAFGQPASDDDTDRALRDLMLDPESIVISVAGTAEAPAASARLIASPRRGVAVLLANGLQAPGAGRAYQVWLLREGTPAPNALFGVDRRGRGASMVRIGRELRAWDTVAVTPEPAGGSPGPTGPIVLVGALADG